MSKPEIDTIYKALEELDQSTIFSGSERNVRILRFLVDCYINDIYVKESVIAIELFGEQGASLSDGKVRGYMFTLRKKLEEYYNTEGKDKDVVFCIEKGQYNLSVENRLQAKAKTGFNTWKVWVLAVLLIGIACVFGMRLHWKSDYCWASFFDKSATNLCCVGDHYTLVGKVGTKIAFSLYASGVNSDSDLALYRKQGKDSLLSLTKADYSFATKMGPIGAARLSYWFTKNNAALDVIMGSDLSLDNLKENNIVYIGPYRHMQQLSNLFLASSSKFSSNGEFIVDKSRQFGYRNQPHKKVREEYVMVSYNRLTDSGKAILFISSNNDIGVMALVKNFTDRTFLKEFYKQLPDKASYFNALFKVKGVLRTDLACELVDVEVLD